MSKFVWEDTFSEFEAIKESEQEYENKLSTLSQPTSTAPSIPPNKTDTSSAFQAAKVEPSQKYMHEPDQGSSSSDHFDEFDYDDFDNEEDESVVLNARMRLEQGRLYEMLLNHKLFENVSAHPKAINCVEREIKRFVKERLEVLLGLKPDPRIKQLAQPVESPQLPFNELEISLLKQVLSKMTKGMTESAQNSNQTNSAQSQQPQSITPIKGTFKGTNRSGGLSSVKPQAQSGFPVKNQALTNKPDANKPVNAGAQVAKTEQATDDRPVLNKSPFKMSASELIERNKYIAEQQRKRKAVVPDSQKLPMPNPLQLEAYYSAMQAQSLPLINAIVNKIYSDN